MYIPSAFSKYKVQRCKFVSEKLQIFDQIAKFLIENFLYTLKSFIRKYFECIQSWSFHRKLLTAFHQILLQKNPSCLTEFWTHHCSEFTLSFMKTLPEFDILNLYQKIARNCGNWKRVWVADISQKVFAVIVELLNWLYWNYQGIITFPKIRFLHQQILTFWSITEKTNFVSC